MIIFRSVFYLIGFLMACLSGAMLLPMGVELFIFQTKGWEEFFLSAFVTGSFGSLLAFSTYSPEKIELKLREAFLLTTLGWVSSSFFAALPLYWSSLNLCFIDAWFESVSALTTTGSTIIPSIENAPKGVLLWRGLLQWLGGTGIIMMAITILPTLRIGGMQLFRSEFSDRSEKILPRASQISTRILSIYLLLSIACFCSLKIAGMDSFNALCHTMATVSTGGLSTHSTSIGFYNHWGIELITIIFMILGAVTYVLYIQLWQGNFKSIYEDSQLRTFFYLLLTATIAITLWNWQNNKEFGISFRESLFVVVSIITSTGFSTTDYTHWGSFPLFIIVMLSIVGGCTGSTSGGIKVFRLQVLSTIAHVHLKQMRRQYGVYVPLYQNQKISESIAMSVLTFIVLYFLIATLMVAFLTFLNMDLSTAFSATLSSLSNIGLGVTELTGPKGMHLSLSSFSKVILMMGMILGRLEIIPIFILLMPSFWKN